MLLLALPWMAALRPLNRLWLRLGLWLYGIVNPIVVALLFYSTMVPIGLLMRRCGKDPLRLRRGPADRLNCGRPAKPLDRTGRSTASAVAIDARLPIRIL